jgi:ABC-2 type transport system permease protein
VKTLVWTIRREMWEHRWPYISLLVGAAVMLIAFGTHRHPEVVWLVERMLLMGGTVVAFVYCGDALHGERRDRSILFWKSAPVSDRIVVFSKAAVAMVVVPALILVLIWIAQLVARLMIPTATVAPAARLLSPAWAAAEVMATMLWQAPVYAWILLVSAWARRAPLLWAMIPATLIATIKAAVGAAASTFGEEIAARGLFRHWPRENGGTPPYPFDMEVLSAGDLLAKPSLWVGVVVALLLLLAAEQVRRRSTPK